MSELHVFKNDVIDSDDARTEAEAEVAELTLQAAYRLERMRAAEAETARLRQVLGRFVHASDTRTQVDDEYYDDCHADAVEAVGHALIEPRAMVKP